MFDIGFFEISLITVIALLVLGPERLPVVARSVGTTIRKAKQLIHKTTQELDREIELEELKKELRKQQEVVTDEK